MDHHRITVIRTPSLQSADPGDAGSPAWRPTMSLPAMTPRRLGADTVLTRLPDRSALFGVLAEIDALGLDLLEVR
jgi:hypothetical protein